MCVCVCVNVSLPLSGAVAVRPGSVGGSRLSRRLLTLFLSSISSLRRYFTWLDSKGRGWPFTKEEEKQKATSEQHNTKGVTFRRKRLFKFKQLYVLSVCLLDFIGADGHMWIMTSITDSTLSKALIAEAFERHAADAESGYFSLADKTVGLDLSHSNELTKPFRNDCKEWCQELSRQ